MSRPDFISDIDIARWSEQIDSNSSNNTLASFAAVREVCYAGYWLSEQLEKLRCPEEIIVRIQFTGGKLSFGRDPWKVHQDLLARYQDNDLEFEENSNELN